MQVNVYRMPEDQAGLNEFLATHELAGEPEFFNDKVYVTYKPSTKAEKLKARIFDAKQTLIEAELHREFLAVTDIGDEKKIREAQDKNERELVNVQARIQRYEECLQQEKSSSK